MQVTVQIWSNRRIPAELADAAIEEYTRVRRLIAAADPGSELALLTVGAAAEEADVSPPQLRFRVSTVATSYALTHAAQQLRANSVEHARLAARGIAYYIGDRRGQPWLHGVSLASEPRGDIAQLPLADAAVASAGSFALFLDAEVVFVEDVADPERHGVRSATVFGPNPLTAERMANLIRGRDAR